MNEQTTGIHCSALLCSAKDPHMVYVRIFSMHACVIFIGTIGVPYNSVYKHYIICL